MTTGWVKGSILNLKRKKMVGIIFQLVCAINDLALLGSTEYLLSGAAPG